MNKRYRIAVIGSTGQGNYGHGLDTAFIGVEQANLIAIADDNADGLKRTGRRLQINQLYADWRKMLETEKPSIVCLGPRWTTDRVAMATAAAEHACHIYCEKPFAATLEETKLPSTPPF